MHPVAIRPHILQRLIARRGKARWFDSLDRKKTALRPRSIYSAAIFGPWVSQSFGSFTLTRQWVKKVTGNYFSSMWWVAVFENKR